MNITPGDAIRGMLTIGAIAFGVALAYGRAPKVGRTCTANTATCYDKTTDLVCEDGKYAATTCKGPRGCHQDNGEVSCDISGAAAGDKCTSHFEGKGACSPDGKALLTCKDGAFTSSSCLGPDACHKEGKDYVCDDSRVALGAPCTAPDDLRCSLDGRQAYRCVGGVFVMHEDCGGPKACVLKDDKLLCDNTVATVGERCRATAWGCSADKTSMVSCGDAGVFEVSQRCRGEGGCHAEGNVLGCDEPSLAEVGDPCSGDFAACAVDHQSMLTCKDGVFAVAATCRCVATKDKIRCAR